MERLWGDYVNEISVYVFESLCSFEDVMSIPAHTNTSIVRGLTIISTLRLDSQVTDSTLSRSLDAGAPFQVVRRSL